jgi:P27 family predicted phage terminase small subunit
MGSRGPLPKKRATSARTAGGQRLRQLPDEADAIFKRLAKDIAGLTPADAAIVEDTARWAAVAKATYADLLAEGLTVTDTAHGNKEESRKNPLLIILRTASEQIRANAQQLGATPMARARMPAADSGEQMSLAELLFADVGMESD